MFKLYIKHYLNSILGIIKQTYLLYAINNYWLYIQENWLGRVIVTMLNTIQNYITNHQQGNNGIIYQLKIKVNQLKQKKKQYFPISKGKYYIMLGDIIATYIITSVSKVLLILIRRLNSLVPLNLQISNQYQYYKISKQIKFSKFYSILKLLKKKKTILNQYGNIHSTIAKKESLLDLKQLQNNLITYNTQRLNSSAATRSNQLIRPICTKNINPLDLIYGTNEKDGSNKVKNAAIIQVLGIQFIIERFRQGSVREQYRTGVYMILFLTIFFLLVSSNYLMNLGLYISANLGFGFILFCLYILPTRKWISLKQLYKFLISR